jgi:hypothetical protein
MAKIENFQGLTRFVAKSLKIWPIFLKKSTGNENGLPRNA